MTRPLRKGLLAGAVGTVVLDLVTYADMAWRGRPASDVPARTAVAALDRAGIRLSGSGEERESRESALGALSGMAAGAGVGAGVSLMRQQGLRLSPVSGSVLTGALAMAAADVPTAALGISDPRTWSREDWVGDALPHLAYGVVTYRVLTQLDRADADAPRTHRPSAGLLLRSLALGVATGARSSLGLVGAAFGGPGTGGTVQRLGRVAALGALGAELVADKHPSTPSRLGRQGIVPRFATSTTGALALAGAEEATVDLPMVVAALGAALGSVVGVAGPPPAAESLPDWQAAVIEDVVALGLTAFAIRGRD